MRHFEVAKGWENNQINLPQRKTAHSAGYDVEVAETIVLTENKVTLVPTGVKAIMQPDEVLLLYVRSSAAVKKGLMLANGTGVVDSDFANNPDNDGHIMFAVWNKNSSPLTLNKGDTIGQAVFSKYLLVNDDTLTGDLRVGGIGSTDDSPK